MSKGDIKHRVFNFSYYSRTMVDEKDVEVSLLQMLDKRKTERELRQSINDYVDFLQSIKPKDGMF